MVNNWSRIALVVFVNILIYSCYTRKDGCLDTYAANYDAGADDHCVQCCTYPELRLNSSNFYGDSIYRRGDTLTNQLGQQFILLGLRYYVSQFRLFQDGTEQTVTEAIQIVETGEIIPDDIKITADNESLVKAGTIRTFGKFDSLQFTMGISEDFANNSFVNLPVGHALLNNYRLNDASGEQASAILRVKVLQPVDTTLSIYIAPDFRMDYTIRDSILTSIPGRPINAKITANYKVLLDDVDLMGSYDQIRILVTDNLRFLLNVR